MTVTVTWCAFVSSVWQYCDSVSASWLRVGHTIKTLFGGDTGGGYDGDDDSHLPARVYLGR